MGKRSRKESVALNGDHRLVEGKVELENHKETKNNVDALQSDYSKYYEKNSIFLPPAVIQQLDNLWGDTIRASGLVELIIDYPEGDFADLYYDQAEFQELAKVTGKLYAALSEAESAVFKQLRAMEKLYKSVAEAQKEFQYGSVGTSALSGNGWPYSCDTCPNHY